jgi:DNA polymerase-1
VTFRLASKPNVQNWPTWAIGKTTAGEDLGSPRSVVIPDYDGDVLISTDFEQFELWTYAKIWNIKNLLKIYESGEYIHGIAFEEVLKRPFFEPGKPRTKKHRLPSVTDLQLLRAKAVPLGFQYGRSGESLAAEHGWPSIEGVRYRNEWFKTNPEYPQSHAKIKFEATQKGRLRPPPGLLLHYPQFKLQAINCFGQTPTAMILTQSIIMIEREFKRRELPHARTVLCVHDSILTNCREQDAEEVHDDIIKPILTRPIPWLGDFRFRYEAKVGKMWDWGMESYDEWIKRKKSISVE